MSSPQSVPNTPESDPETTSAEETPRAATDAASADDSVGDEAMRSAFGRPVAEQDQASLPLVVVRDVAIVSIALTLFGAAQTWALASGLGIAAFVATVNGFVVGAGVGALLHEWGHFAGARFGGGHAPLKPISGFLPLFDYDYANNDARAFDWMGIGGNLAHWSVVLVVLTSFPLGQPGSAALVAGAFGFAVFSSVIEVPVIQKSRQGMGGLQALGTIPRDFVQRYLPLAVGAGLLAFVVL